jgi:Ca2+-binding RTX toxin-like protein
MGYFKGTALANHIVGTASADTILGLDGNDILEGRAGNDLIDGGSGNDRIIGGAGADKLTGGSGNDSFVFGFGCGKDVITDFSSGDVLSISGYRSAKSVAQVGADVIITLSTSDKITVSNADLTAVQAALQFPSGSTIGASGNTITGTNSWDTLTGTSGNDTIYGLGGHDVINGGGGSDRIYGGLDGDDLTGGAGADLFIYSSVADAPPYGLMYYESDRILDFQSIDKIDLSAMDANSLLAGKQSFHLSTSTSDHSAGSLHIGVDSGYVWLYGYTDNSGYATVYIDLTGGAVPTAANLIL